MFRGNKMKKMKKNVTWPCRSCSRWYLSCLLKYKWDISEKKVQDSKQLVLAVSPDYPPFEYQTIKNGKNTVVGIDIDLANAIAKKIGCEVESKYNGLQQCFDSLVTR